MANNGRKDVRDFITMQKLLRATVIIATCLAVAVPAFAAPAKKKHRVDRHWHGYGFLPGYRSPERIAWERAHSRPRYSGYYYYFGSPRPRIYQGQVTDSGVGPCWTQTPIGPMWNCGK
jgi:hypothetical protein